MRFPVAAAALLLAAVAVRRAQAQCNPTPCGVNTDCSVSGGGAAVCRCSSGWDHAAGSNTIDGCPVRISDNSQRSAAPPRPASRPRPRPFSSPPRSAVGVLGNRLGNNRIATRVENGDPCRPTPCGENTECTSQGNRAVCSCQRNHYGDPYTRCELDPCKQTQCGINAECHDEGRRAICKCPRGWFGDPFDRCFDDPCLEGNPCAPNADCRSEGQRAICTCRPGYEGDGIQRCTLNPCLDPSACGINAECSNRNGRADCQCPPQYEGDPYRRCTLNPCAGDVCGENADCEAQGSSARCSCRPGYVGDPDPTTRCRLEPCSTDPCGIDAECESRGRQAVCKCPRGYQGDPYTRCSPDPCGEDPCGVNAICEHGNRVRNPSAYTCTCPPDYVGNAYDVCTFDPCTPNPCGPNTECTVSGDRAICACNRGYTGDPNSRSTGCRADPCAVSDPCGRNAICENQGSRPVCRCEAGTVGDPFQECFRGTCVSNSDCSDQEACQNYNCVDPCSTTCGSGADCDVRRHVAICRCPRGFTGDPFQACRRFTKDEICAACGANTNCEVGQDDRPICSCKPNFVGNPLQGCRYECERDNDCSAHQKCEQFRCTAVCDQDACGEGANCRPQNHRADCTCPDNFIGSPQSRCYPECTKHNDCNDQEACVDLHCEDPCFRPTQVCGSGADCNVKNHTPVCSCPKGFTGDPFQSCRRFTREDLCNPNPCGLDARCQPGSDRSGNDKPVCTCPSGYRGDPLVACRRGECEHDEDCSSSQGCYNFRCENPCQRDSCGISADCRPRNHAAVCSCPSGTVGDPLVACRESRRSQNRVIGQTNRRRYRRDANEDEEEEEVESGFFSWLF